MGRQTGFDYEVLDAADAVWVRGRTVEIREMIQRSVADLLSIGRTLLAVKKRLPHGHFGNWLRSEFQWSERTAQRFMAVAANPTARSDLKIGPRALVELTATGAPPEALEEAIERSDEGEPITVVEAKRIVHGHKSIQEAMDAANLDENERAALVTTLTTHEGEQQKKKEQARKQQAERDQDRAWLDQLERLLKKLDKHLRQRTGTDAAETHIQALREIGHNAA